MTAKELQAHTGLSFCGCRLCPSDIQDLAGNILEIRKAGGQNQTKDAFGFELRSLNVSAAAEIVNRRCALVSTASEGTKWLATLLGKYQGNWAALRCETLARLRKLRRRAHQLTTPDSSCFLLFGAALSGGVRCVFRGWERRHYRHEGFAVSRHAPDCGQQFSHRGDDGDFSWFACGSEPFVVLPQPRITPHHL
jgi:hypothetical protein